MGTALDYFRSTMENKETNDSTKRVNYSTCSVTTKIPGPSAEDGSSRADRYNSGKPKLSFMLDFPNAMEMMADVADYGAKKYSLHNWKKGLPVRKIADSLLRHLTDYMNGEDVDEESLCYHLGHIVWNACALAEMGYPPGSIMDDRDGHVT